MTATRKLNLGTVNGHDVIKDEDVLSGLGIPVKYRLLTLADSSQTFGCGECPRPTDFTGTRGEVRLHRVQEHGMKAGAIRQRSSDDPLAIDADDEPGLPVPDEDPDEDGVLVGVPVVVQAMTIGEVVRLGGRLQSLGDLMETMRIENAELTRDLKAANRRAETAEEKLAKLREVFASIGLAGTVAA